MCNSAEPHLRESYRSLFVYLPLSYEDFEKHLPLVLPIFYEGLCDETEEIRNLSMRVLKICTEKYGKSSTDKLLSFIIENIFSTTYWI